MVAVTQMYSVNVTAEERADLLRLLDRAIRDIHAEARRTENPMFQNTIHEEERRLRNLADKFRETSLTLLRGPAAL